MEKIYKLITDYHVSQSVELALLTKPIKIDIKHCRIIEIERNELNVKPIMALDREIPIPDWYTNPYILHKIRLKFSILCSRSVLDIFEQEYPEDKSPRLAIETAEKVLKAEDDPDSQCADLNSDYGVTNASYAAVEAESAAFDSISAAAADAAYAAAEAARAAEDVASDVPNAAAGAAARAADDARDAADAAGRNIDFNALAKQAVAEYIN